MSAPLINPSPVVHRRRASRRAPAAEAEDSEERQSFDSAEVFSHLRDISDPEHPYTLEQARRGAGTSCRPLTPAPATAERAERGGCLCGRRGEQNRVRRESRPCMQWLTPYGLRRVFFTPTVSHCSMATLIGLCVRVQLLRALPRRFKVDIYVAPGSHSSEAAVNKQLNDKERVAAALENPTLLDKVNLCLRGQMAM